MQQQMPGKYLFGVPLTVTLQIAWTSHIVERDLKGRLYIVGVAYLLLLFVRCCALSMVFEALHKLCILREGLELIYGPKRFAG